MMKKVPAFTLIELIIVMIISSLLITFIWSSYSFLIKNYRDISAKSEIAEKMAAFEYQLNADINNAESIILQGNRFILNMGPGNLTYLLYNNKIIRGQNLRNDTLKVEQLHFDATLLDNIPSNPNIVKDVYITFDMYQRKYKWTIHKDYPSLFKYNLTKNER